MSENEDWKVKTIATWKQSEAASYEAQLSIAPDGTKFAGVRQYITTKKSGRIAGRQGINFKVGPDTLDSVNKIEELFSKLKTAILSSGPKDEFVLYKAATRKYLKDMVEDRVKVTPDLENARLFTKVRAKEVLSKLSSDWKIRPFKKDPK